MTDIISPLVGFSTFWFSARLHPKKFEKISSQWWNRALANAASANFAKENELLTYMEKMLERLPLQFKVGGNLARYQAKCWEGERCMHRYETYQKLEEKGGRKSVCLFHPLYQRDSRRATWKSELKIRWAASWRYRYLCQDASDK